MSRLPRAILITYVGQVASMNEETIREATPILADHADYLIATAARAPSVHNTQPWRFAHGERHIDVYADVDGRDDEHQPLFTSAAKFSRSRSPQR